MTINPLGGLLEKVETAIEDGLTAAGVDPRFADLVGDAVHIGIDLYTGNYADLLTQIDDVVEDLDSAKALYQDFQDGKVGCRFTV